MTPIITNDNFETLRVMVAYYDPTIIPPTLTLHKDPKVKNSAKPAQNNRVSQDLQPTHRCTRGGDDHHRKSIAHRGADGKD